MATIKTTVRIPHEQKARAQAEADRLGISLNALILQALDLYLNEKEEIKCSEQF